MTDSELVQHLANGLTVKEIASSAKEKCRAMEYRIILLREKTLSTTVSHLVANYFRKQLIK